MEQQAQQEHPQQNTAAAATVAAAIAVFSGPGFRPEIQPGNRDKDKVHPLWVYFVFVLFLGPESGPGKRSPKNTPAAPSAAGACDLGGLHVARKPPKQGTAKSPALLKSYNPGSRQPEQLTSDAA